jgi:hypothetical protein
MADMLDADCSKHKFYASFPDDYFSAYFVFRQHKDSLQLLSTYDKATTLRSLTCR